MSSILPTTVIVTPHYVSGREFNKRLRTAYPDAGAILQIALDLRDGRLVVVNANERYAKRLAEFVTIATGWPTSARIKENN